ncbi:MAG TPA: divalent-cation tolerance protein CutA [Bryobacteraceae bacterium]|jgi:periplasmic divalent cation tolerance protein|nr:divalent-cation tolerance protein CutA [Bryobacteraceae bacterium]
MTDKIIALTTCDSQDEARSLARKLVESRLVACVNIVSGVESVYHWQGKVETSAEWLLVMKTSRELLQRLKTEISRLHSYTLPELLALPIVDGSEGYLEWLDRSLLSSEAIVDETPPAGSRETQ